MTNSAVTETTKKNTRAELRRAFLSFKRMKRYEESGFLDNASYIGVKIKPSKYMPHIGNKQKGIKIENAV